MHAPVRYAEYGVRTRPGLFWFVATLLVAHLTLQILNGLREGLTASVYAGVIWTVLLMVATARSLRQLAALERDDPQPTPSMKLAFSLVLVIPIVGTVPLFFPSFTRLLH